MLVELCKGRVKWKIKKVERWRDNKVRESKVGVEKCVDFYLKEKWLYYYGTYQNGKMTLLLWNEGSSTYYMHD